MSDDEKVWGRHVEERVEHPPPGWVTADDVRQIIREHDRRLAAKLREANYGRQSEALGKLADILEADDG